MDTHVATALVEGEARAAGERLGSTVTSQIGEATLAVVFGSTRQPLEGLLAAVRSQLPRTALIGLSTAGEFTESREGNGSACIFAVAGDYQVRCGIGTGLKANTEHALGEACCNLPAAIEGYPHRTAIMFTDGLAGVGEEAVLFAGMRLGEGIQIAGAAAGDDWQVKATHVGIGTQAATDGVAIAMIYSKIPLGVGVAHGHQPYTESLTVTRAEGNVVHELDGRPAWDVWVEMTRLEALKDGIDPATLPMGADSSRFFARFPAGLPMGDSGVYKARPVLFRLPGGALGFSCGIAQGTELQMLRTSPELQRASARDAARRARTQLGDRKPAGAVVFDCVCRKLTLGDDFHSAVRGISDELGGAKLAGFESYGEVALMPSDWSRSGFHNETTVLVAFPQ
jgi:methyl-accepting chemotaxis protein